MNKVMMIWSLLLLVALSVHAQSPDDELIGACIVGDQTEITRLLDEEGANVDYRNSLGETAVRTAVDRGHPEVLELLAKKGADLDRADYTGVSPLMMVVMRGDLEATKELVRLGANVDYVDSYGFSVMQYAIDGKSEEVVTFLSTKVKDVSGAIAHAKKRELNDLVSILEKAK